MGFLKNFLTNWFEKRERDRKEKEAWNLQESAWKFAWTDGKIDRAKSVELYIRSAALYAEIEQNKDAAKYYHLAGEQENEQGNHAEANRWFELAIKLNPECGEAYRDLAVNCADGNGIEIDQARAVELFKKAVEFLARRSFGKQETAECCLRAAELESHLGHPSEAEKWRKKAAELIKMAEITKSTFYIPKFRG